MSEIARDTELLPFAAPIAIAEVDLETWERRNLVEGARSFGRTDGIGRVLMASPDELEPLVASLALDSTAELSVPVVDVDSDETFDVLVGCYIDEGLVVAITGVDPIPKDTISDLAERILAELPDKPLDQVRDVGRDARWVVVRILRQRVRDIEASVRDALGDEHISHADYAALREYPMRLARVERLAAGIREPTWKSAHPRQPWLTAAAGPDMLWKSLVEVGADARDAVARLSGLIASQSVVVAQRQAAETERFQRLITLVGTTVLVPGLVAAVFGANVDLPGEDSRSGFWAMLCFMVASGAASYALLRSFEQDFWTAIARRLGLASRDPSAERRRLLALVAVAVVAAVSGLVILS